MDRQAASDLLPLLVRGALTAKDRRAVEEWCAQDPTLAAERDALLASAAPPTASPPSRPSHSRRWQAAAGVLLAVALAQGAVLALWSWDRGYPAPGLGAAPLTIAFVSGATEEALRMLLLDAGARIVEGPSALGLYGLVPAEGVTLDEAQAALLASPLVETLERAAE